MSFDHLITRISPTLKRITHRLNGHHSFFDDEDLYQEAVIHLWLHYKQGSLSDKTDSYILQGCYFHLRNYLRKVQDKVPVLSINTGVGEDGTKLEDILTIDGMATFDYLESKIDVEAHQDLREYIEFWYAPKPEDDEMWRFLMLKSSEQPTQPAS